jgi:hypothetical protein
LALSTNRRFSLFAAVPEGTRWIASGGAADDDGVGALAACSAAGACEGPLLEHAKGLDAATPRGSARAVSAACSSGAR